jgi:hypothetical protein
MIPEDLHLSAWHVLALVHNTIISETRIDQERARYGNLGPIDLGLAFYGLIVFFDLKERRKDRTPVLKQRHQPHYNVRQ